MAVDQGPGFHSLAVEVLLLPRLLLKISAGAMLIRYKKKYPFRFFNIFCFVKCHFTLPNHYMEAVFAELTRTPTVAWRSLGKGRNSAVCPGDDSLCCSPSQRGVAGRGVLRLGTPRGAPWTCS